MSTFWWYVFICGAIGGVYGVVSYLLSPRTDTDILTTLLEIRNSLQNIEENIDNIASRR